jgi:hypothetical protein
MDIHSSSPLGRNNDKSQPVSEWQRLLHLVMVWVDHLGYRSGAKH